MYAFYSGNDNIEDWFSLIYPFLSSQNYIPLLQWLTIYQQYRLLLDSRLFH